MCLNVAWKLHRSKTMTDIIIISIVIMIVMYYSMNIRRSELTINDSNN